METKYEQLYKNSKEAYDNAHAKYLNIINSKEYIESIYSAPFDFLKALYLSKRVELFNDAPAGKKPHFTLTSLQEAISTYKDIMLYKENITDLLDKATIINQAADIADKINNMVELSNYLDDNLLISYDAKIASLAKECVKELPRTAKFITSDLRESFLLDVATCIKEEPAIALLCQKKMFKRADLNVIYHLAVTDEQKEGLNRLYKAFNVETTPLLSTSLRLKGVTFEGKNGDDRQNNIALLKEYIQNTKEAPALAVEPFTYIPDIGSPEPAVRILWGERDLGFLPKDVAAEIHDKYDGKIINTSVKQIVGGDTVSYGLEVNLEIIDPILEEEKEIEEREINN